MWSCHQSLITLAFLWEKLLQLQFCKDLTRNITFFEGCPWFKFKNLRLAIGVTLKFYTSVAKELKLKSRKFWRISPTFVEVTGEKVVGGPFCTQPHYEAPGDLNVEITKDENYTSTFLRLMTTKFDRVFTSGRTFIEHKWQSCHWVLVYLFINKVQ